jgi:general nucleoside transport system permease protein
MIFANSTDPDLMVIICAIAVAVLGGAIRVGTPILYVSLGECLTEKSGRVNLGLEGTLVMGAMTGYGISYVSSLFLPEALIWACPWLGVLAAGVVGLLLGGMHAVICNLPKVNSVAVGIAMMVFGVALAFCLGKNLIQPQAPKLPAIDFAYWITRITGMSTESWSEPVKFALNINVLFLIGLVLAPFLSWALRSTRWGMILRLAGESEEAALAMGYSVNRIRTYATALGGFLAGVGGSYLSLYYPGSWNEQLSSGQGLMAVALVIFARWNPVLCLCAALLFGGVGSLGSALQGQKLTTAAAAYIWNAAPYIVTLLIMVITSSRSRALAGAPGALTAIK